MNTASQTPTAGPSVRFFVLLALGSVQTLAGAASETSIDLPTVYVTTATRTLHDITTAPAPIQLIDSADVKAAGATTLRGILDLAPGLYVSPSGTNLQIRGLGGSDTLYLLDGRRIKGEFSNTFELERIAASMIDRIEIVRGPASMLYGADALGGVVNIITRRPAAGLEGGVDTQYGANDRGDGARGMLAADLRGGNETLNFSFYASHLHRDPYAERETAQVTVPQSGVQIAPSRHPNAKIKKGLADSYAVDVDYRDQADVDTIGGALEWQATPDVRLTLDLNAMREEREGTYISSRYATNILAAGKAIQAANIPARQYDDNERLDTALTLDWSLLDTLDLRYRLHHSRYDKDRVVYAVHYADLGYTTRNDSASSINESTMTQWVNELTSVWRPGANHTLVGGLEHRDNDVESTAYDVDARTFDSAFLQHEWQILPSLNAVYGARYDDDSVGGSHLSFQAGGIWTLSPLARLRANFAQGYKAPDDRSLYVDQVNPQGVPMLGAEVINPDQGKTSAHSLDPESSDTFEIGLAGGAATWDYGVTLFHTSVTDRIETVREGSGQLTYNTFRNISEARIQGVETEGSISLTPSLRARAAFTRFNAENRETGDPLLNTPETLASLTLDYNRADWLLQTIVSYAGEQDYSGRNGTETAAGYTLVHLKASYTPPMLAGVEVYGGIDNLLDEKIDPGLGSDPGPYAYLGVRYTF
ncbi:TonB-dependent receptor plug domain-containing protein [Thiobaca trueperi]|uniref:Outer membrane receptor for ferrienterochelin and colicins n=1 Tax=Thiobaca trueperi TaxID=127458 RepID=A0A4R3NAJ6_9GAMM|nr:TonB-dependent receptor [Thiobaca trueperi]TCT24039.1 outer membrane receptor for ferrienterochelin and colicins [Thiobaca trueperi]